MGKPTKIYVMNFLGVDAEKENLVVEEPEDFSKVEVMTSENEKSSILENRSQDFSKKELINTDINKNEFNETEKNKTNQSINPSKTSDMVKKEKEMDRWMEYRDIFKKNIEYEYIIQQDPEIIPEILEVLIETACSNAKSFSINGAKIPAERVRERLLSLNSMDIDYVLDSLNQNTSKVQNIRAYLLATLYNAPKTVNSFIKLSQSPHVWQVREWR